MSFLADLIKWGVFPGVKAANPTGTIGTSAVNGSASTFMRSDAAPAFGNLTGDVTSVGLATTLITTQPGAHTWTLAQADSALHTFNAGATTVLNNSDGSNTTTTGAAMIMENPSGSQTKWLATFAGTSKGGLRVDSSGNLNWLSVNGSQGHQFYVGASAATQSFSAGPNGILIKGAAGDVAINALDIFGILSFRSNGAISATPDVFLSRGAAATLNLGAANAASPVAQTLQVQSVVAGTTDTAGTDWTRIASLPTGTGAGGNIIEKTGISAKSTGTSQATAVDREITVAKGKVLTSGAALSLFDVALPTLAMCGGSIEATIVCTDGTDMQSFTQTVTYSAVNKGAAYTTSITASAGDKSVSAGTLTTSWTIVSGTNKVTIKVTPTTSLTPSTNAFLIYFRMKNNSEQATTII